MIVKPLIFWEGFPPCGLLIRQVVKLYGPRLRLLGTRASMRFASLEQRLGVDVEWLQSADDIWEHREKYSDYNLVIHTGWNHPGWLRFDRWMKTRGAKIVLVSDNSYKRTIRQFVGAVWFRLYYRRLFDAVLVPGRSGSQLLEFLGMPSHRIIVGSYGADESIYSRGVDWAARRKEFLYVGQLVKRKGFDVLMDAFCRYRRAGGTWALRVCGSGVLESMCGSEGVIFEGFAQPTQVADLMRHSSILVLPSREDHWGTVICEAMACGALVLTTRHVGSSEDLVRNGVTGWVLSELTVPELAGSLKRLSNLSDAQGTTAQRLSYTISAAYDSNSYLAAHHAILHTLFSE